MAAQHRAKCRLVNKNLDLFWKRNNQTTGEDSACGGAGKGTPARGICRTVSENPEHSFGNPESIR